MKKQIWIFFGIIIFGFFGSGLVLAAEQVDLATAKNAAEYYGTRIYKQDLKVGDHLLMSWPWGEPAVYVFTLIERGDVYPQSVYLDTPFLQGAYLVSQGDKVRGYQMMAQANRYFTVFVGATTDMPAFIKTYAGLPEHVLALGEANREIENRSLIYGGPFSIYLKQTDKNQNRAGILKSTGEAIEIHTGEKVFLEEFGRYKIGRIPLSEQHLEWSPFIDPALLSESDTFLSDQVVYVQDNTKTLPVKESNLGLPWEGCYPASMYNILMYYIQTKQVKVSTENEILLDYPEILLKYIAICCRTWDYSHSGETLKYWFVRGAKLIYKGFDTQANIKSAWRKFHTRSQFYDLCKAEIDADHPFEIGGGNHSPLYGHSCVGLGYSIINGKKNLILHDGIWHTTKPVQINYAALEGKHLGAIRIHPIKSFKYASAVPKLKGRRKATVNTKARQFENKIKVISENKLKAYFCASEMKYYDRSGKLLKDLSYELVRKKPPYSKSITIRGKFKNFPRGIGKFSFYIIDNNGHIKKEKFQLIYEHVIGRWTMHYKWKGKNPGTSTWTIYENGDFKSSSGQGGTWSMKNKSFTIRYATDNAAVYRGSIIADYQKMTGTMSNKKGSTGTWSAIRQSDNPSGINE